MARHIAWAVALLLAGPVYGHAASLSVGATCDREQAARPQRNGQPPAGGRQGDKPGKPGEPGSKQRPKWWIDPKLRAELNITDQQSAAVDAVWQKTAPLLWDARERLDKLEDALSAMIQKDGSDETAVLAQIERVENTRAEAAKTRTIMIYRMNKLLTADQRAKVKAMYERREPPKHGSSSR
jgi:Spy/CpxP family protein refolding chaperone